MTKSGQPDRWTYEDGVPKLSSVLPVLGQVRLQRGKQDKPVLPFKKTVYKWADQRRYINGQKTSEADDVAHQAGRQRQSEITLHPSTLQPTPRSPAVTASRWARQWTSGGVTRTKTPFKSSSAAGTRNH